MVKLFQAVLAWALLFLLNQCQSMYIWNREGESGHEDSGFLCDASGGPGNDIIGHRLGCDCNKMSMTSDFAVQADCSNRRILAPESNLLPDPPKINISGRVLDVDFSYNLLESLNLDFFHNCSSVQTISFRENKIKYFEGIRCPRLASLDLSGNDLKNLTKYAFKDLERLQEIDLSHNNLIYLDTDLFSGLPILRKLDLSYNLVGKELFYLGAYTLNLRNMQELEILNLRNTTLSSFPVSLVKGTKSLRKLDLQDNLIVDLSAELFAEINHLEELDLSGNSLETIGPYAFKGLYNLNSLRLDRMPTLRSIEAQAFVGLPSLIILSSSFNKELSYIDEMAFREKPEKNSTVENAHPAGFHIKQNALTYLPPDLLDWGSLDQLESQRNPWKCDCKLRWIAELHQSRPQDSTVFMDYDFLCESPSRLNGLPVSALNPEEMSCGNTFVTTVGAIFFFLFCLIIVLGIIFIVLNHYNKLPRWLLTYDIVGRQTVATRMTKYRRVKATPVTIEDTVTQDDIQ